MELVEASIADITGILNLQRKSFEKIFEKYQDKSTSPYLETEDDISRRMKRDDYRFFYFSKKKPWSVISVFKVWTMPQFGLVF
jgi:hypothetical protein